MWEKRWLQTAEKPSRDPNPVRGIPGVSSLTRRWGQRRFNEKHLSARNKILRFETASHRGFLRASLQKNADLHISSLCFPRPHSYGCSSSYFSSPGIPKTTQSVTIILSSLPVPVTRNDLTEPKSNERCCEFVSLPLWTFPWDYATDFFENPCYFYLLSVHSLLRLLFFSSSLNSKWEPFCFVASGQPQLMFRLSVWSIHLFRDFFSGKALYSQLCLGGFQSHYKIIRILQSFIIIPWNFIPVI